MCLTQQNTRRGPADCYRLAGSHRLGTLRCFSQQRACGIGAPRHCDISWRLFSKVTHLPGGAQQAWPGMLVSFITSPVAKGEYCCMWLLLHLSCLQPAAPGFCHAIHRQIQTHDYLEAELQCLTPALLLLIETTRHLPPEVGGIGVLLLAQCASVQRARDQRGVPRPVWQVPWTMGVPTLACAPACYRWGGATVCRPPGQAV